MIHLKAGETAPRDGWLVADQWMAELYDALGRRLPPGSPDDATSTAQPSAE